MKFEGRWGYCELCDTPAIDCKECGFSSCSGCGCEHCREDFREAHRMIDNGEAPKKEDIPFWPDQMKILLDEINENSSSKRSKD